VLKAWSTYGGNEKYIQNFGQENLKGRGHWEEPSAYGKIIL
jgi:hypothetical protein